MTRKPKIWISCPGPEQCDHTVAEHEAFDTGVSAGELGIDEEDYPLWWPPELVQTWLAGHSVGVLNREAKKKG